MAQEEQSTDVTIKKCVFFNGANFVKVHRNNIFKRKKRRDTSRFDQSICEKLLNPIGCIAVEKRVENFIFFSDELISRKTQNKGKFCFFLTRMLVS